MKKRFKNIRLCTDVHETFEVEKLAGIIDVIQIPAFLCKQTKLMVACAEHFDIVFTKKGQWISPETAIMFLDKIKTTNPNCKAWLGERGTQWGPDQLLIDFSIVEQIRKHYDKFILDVAHCCHRSREKYGTQADIKMIKKYFLATPIFGYDGSFIEVHPNPLESSSDCDSQIKLKDFPKLLEQQDETRALKYVKKRML